MVIGEHDVFFHYNYLNQLIKDLREAKSLVILYSPFLGYEQFQRLKSGIQKCLDRGVRVCIFVLEANPKYKQDPMRIATMNEIVAQLRAMGVHVNLRPLVHEKLAIFDEFASYEGSLNFMSHADTKERTNRWKCLQKRRELIASHKLDSCDECLASSGFCRSPLQSDPPDITREALLKRQLTEQQVQFGRLIANRRENLRLTQKQLGERVGLSQSYISLLEKGKGNPGLAHILRICSALDMGLRPIPLYMVPATDEASQLLHKPKITAATSFCPCGCGFLWEDDNPSRIAPTPQASTVSTAQSVAKSRVSTVSTARSRPDSQALSAQTSAQLPSRTQQLPSSANTSNPSK